MISTVRTLKERKIVQKFACQGCGGILQSSLEDKLVLCPHCNNTCRIPTEIGPGTAIDDFLIQEIIGQGGMGIVYLAYQFSLDRHVALKILHQQIIDDPVLQEDLIREARTVASLNHPNIVQAYKVGIEEEILFFAMEWVEGVELNKVLADQGPLSEGQAIKIAIDTAEALTYAWEKKQLVHRDIKPENIMIAGDGNCKIMDLGLSKTKEQKDDDPDLISGTPQYMSPEQIRGDGVDIRTDFYCLGATLFYLVSGNYVFQSDNLQQMLNKHLTEVPERLRDFIPDISVGFSEIVDRLLRKKPEERYQTGRELIDALEKVGNSGSGKIRVNPNKIKRVNLLESQKNILEKKIETKFYLILASIVASLLCIGGAAVMIVKSSSTPGNSFSVNERVNQTTANFEHSNGPLKNIEAISLVELWSPLSLRPATWVDARNIESVKLEEGKVVEWEDQSGNENHFTSQPAKRPVYVEGRYVTNTELSSMVAHNCTNGEQPVTIYCVLDKVPAKSSFFGTFYSYGSVVRWKRLLAGIANNGNGFFSVRPGTTTTFDKFGNIIGNTVITAIKYDGTLNKNYSISASVNGESFLEADRIKVTNPWSRNEYMILFGETLNIRINEYIVFSRLLTDSECQQLEGYLAHKWGLREKLPIWHPYREKQLN